MENVYKGVEIIKKFKNKPYSWATKHYFYTTIKKLFGKFYIVAKYKKFTQYYKPKKIMKLKKYVNLHVCKQIEGKYIIDGKLSDLYDNETLIIRCLSKQDNSYIGCPHNTYKLLDLGIRKFYKLDDDNAVLGSTADNEWYAWNGKDVAKLKTSRFTTIKEAKEILIKFMTDPIDIPDTYADEVNKEIRTETKHIIKQLKEIKNNNETE